MESNEMLRFVSLAEVKNTLKQLSSNRKELSYEQRIAFEHAQRFARLSVKKTQDLVKELMGLKRMEEPLAFKIADILPVTEDDVKAIYAKERFTPTGEEIKNILEVVQKYNIVE